MPDSSLILHAHGLSRSYGGRPAVDGVSIELRRGEVLGLLGPNGAGKSTTMRLLTGNLRPDAGTVRICGMDLFEQPLKAKARLGYLPETPPLYRDMSVNDYLGFAARLHGTKAIEKIKAKCGIAEVGKRLIGSLSKGYQQRVGIAQAIVHDPDVVILDEPTSGLDPNQIVEIRQLIRELGKNHGVILSTHILSEAESLCDRVEILHSGKRVYGGDIRGHSIEVGFRNPPPPEALKAIGGVAGVEILSPGLFRLYPVQGGDPTEAVVMRASERNWGLQRIHPSKSSLEAVFAELAREAE